MKTEEEAKGCWCPYARDVEGDDNGVQMAMASFNRPWGDKYAAYDTCKCIASQCMAWRWGEEKFAGKPTIEQLEKILAGPEPLGKRVRKRMKPHEKILPEVRFDQCHVEQR